MTSIPNLEHLRSFLTVYRTGSLTEAAAQLGLSQPTITAHLQALESALGYRLFIRDRSGATPTGPGLGLARQVGAHLDALEELVLGAALGSEAPTLHIGGPAEFLSTMIISRLGELNLMFPSPLWFRFGLADELLESLRAGDLDIVVSSVQPHVIGLTAEPFYDEEFALVAAPKWGKYAQESVRSRPATEGWSHRLDDVLSQVPMLSYAGDLPIVRRYWRTVFGHRPDRLMLRAVIPDLRAIRAALVGGAGMSVLPRYLIQKDLVDGDLVLLHDPELPPLNTVYLAMRSGRAANGSAAPALARAMHQLMEKTDTGH